MHTTFCIDEFSNARKLLNCFISSLLGLEKHVQIYTVSLMFNIFGKCTCISQTSKTTNTKAVWLFSKTRTQRPKQPNCYQMRLLMQLELKGKLGITDIEVSIPKCRRKWRQIYRSRCWKARELAQTPTSIQRSCILKAYESVYHS